MVACGPYAELFVICCLLFPVFLQAPLQIAWKIGFLPIFALLAAVMAVMAGAKTAKAWDQQATGEQMNYELNYRALQAGNAARQYPSGAYASANPHPRGSAYHGSSEGSFGTSVPGLFLAGDLTAGRKGGSIILAFNTAAAAMRQICEDHRICSVVR